jgi:hypothetical protein
VHRDYGRDRDPELWGREIHRDDWQRGTYGAPGSGRGGWWGQGRGPSWQRGDNYGGGMPGWSRDWSYQDREGWQRSPNYSWQDYPRDYSREAWTEGTSREPWAGAAYGDYWSAPREGWSGGHWHGRTTMRGWQRSDERISEDVCSRLCDHPEIDTSEIDVIVEHGEVTLQGTVDDRFEKRLAEDIAETVPGVRDIHNRLRTQDSWHGERLGQHHVRNDMQVVGIDGEQIGRITEVHGTEFLVDRPMASNVFVPMQYVQHTRDDQVVLSVPAGEVEHMHWRSPQYIGG